MIGILRVGNNESISLSEIPLVWDVELGPIGTFIEPFKRKDVEWFWLTYSGNWLRTFQRRDFKKRVRFQDAEPSQVDKGWLFTSVSSVFWGKSILLLDEWGGLSVRLHTCDYGETRDLQVQFREGQFRFFTAGQEGQWHMSLE